MDARLGEEDGPAPEVILRQHVELRRQRWDFSVMRPQARHGHGAYSARPLRALVDGMRKLGPRCTGMIWTAAVMGYADANELVAELERIVRDHGSVAQAARHLGLARANLHKLL